MKAYQKIRAALCRGLEWGVMFTMGVLVVVVMIQIFARVFELDCGWTEEVATYLLIWAGLLGASVGFARNSHLGIDYLVDKTGKSSRRLIDVMVQLIVIFFAVYPMIWGGGKVVADTLMRGQVSTALQVPMGYIYLAIPISGAFIALFAIEKLVVLLAQNSQKEEA